MLLFWKYRSNRPGEESLQRSGIDAGIAKLPRGAGSWGKALDLKPLRFRSAANDRKRRGLARSGESLDALNTVWRTQHILNHVPLRTVGCFDKQFELTPSRGPATCFKDSRQAPSPFRRC